MYNDTLFGCLYCGQLQGSPSEKAFEILGDKAIMCCDHRMAEIDECILLKIVKGLETLQKNIHEKLIEGF